MFAKFEEDILLFETQNLLSETQDNTERGNKYDDESTMSTLNNEE